MRARSGSNDSGSQDDASDFTRHVEMLECKIGELREKKKPLRVLTAVSLLERAKLLADGEEQTREREDQREELNELEQELCETLRTEQSSAVEEIADAVEHLCAMLPNRVSIALSLTPISNETHNALLLRDRIAFCERYLPSGAVSSRTEGRIEALDAALYAKYRKKAADHESELQHAAIHHYPEEMWWRHPEQFFDGNEPRVSVWNQQHVAPAETPLEVVRENLVSLADSDTVVLQHDSPIAAGESALQMRDEVEVALRRVPRGTADEHLLGQLDGIDALLYDKFQFTATMAEKPRHESKYWQGMSNIAEPSLPHSFWWRHPDQFLPENDGPFVDMWSQREVEW